MLPSFATIKMKAVPPSWKPWKPHAYQARAVEFLKGQGAAALFLDPGLGKTSITLGAISELKAEGRFTRALIVAPRRVCQLVWRQEGRKWEQFRELRFCFLHGPKKNKLLKEGIADGTDIFLINPEGIPWLVKQYVGRQLPFDTVVLDELTKFKNSQAQRSRALRPHIHAARRRWGLTGSPAPNGLLDLFGQFLMLDDGAALGRYLTHYRDTYFQPDFNGFDYVLQPGGEARIRARIEPYVMCMKAEDYIEIPELVDDVRELSLEQESRAKYDILRKQMLVQLEGGVVEAANTASVYSKLKQMANGAVYDGIGATIHVHDGKLDALEDLVDELNGKPLLVAYEFNHDLARLKERFKGPDVAFMADANEAQAMRLVQRWNAGELRLLFAHPASAGHGLNLQEGGAAHCCWFGPMWDFELYDQFIRRLRRQGSTAPRVVNHILVMLRTIDELALAALREKDTTQTRLQSALKSVLLDDMGAGPLPAVEGEPKMPALKLPRMVPDATAKPAAKGWPVGGTSKGPASEPQPIQTSSNPQLEAWKARLAQLQAGAAGTPAQVQQAEAIEQKLAGDDQPDNRGAGLAGFSVGIRERLTGVPDEESGAPAGGTPTEATTSAEELPFTPDAPAEHAAVPAAKPVRTRKSRAAMPVPAEHADAQPSFLDDVVPSPEYMQAVRALRWEILHAFLLIEPRGVDFEDVIADAKAAWEFVNG